MGQKLSSDLGMANQRANALSQAGQTLQTASSVTKDHMTTVAGNNNASKAITSTHQAAMTISAAVSTSSNQLKTVASNFEAEDRQAKSLFSQPLPILSGGK